MRRSKGSVPAGLTISICALALAVVTVGLTAQASGTTGGPAARLTAQASGTTGSPAAKAANRMDLVEVAHLKLSGEEGSAISERGQATGTYDAPVTATFAIHPASVTVVVTIYPRGGSITGVAHANYTVVKSVGYFGGTFRLGRGTGKYRHVTEVGGKALGFSGTINRNSFAVEVKAKGEIDL